MYKRQSPNFQVSRKIVARPPPSEDVLEKKRSEREWAFQMQSYNNVIKKHVGRPTTQYIIIDKNKVKPRRVGRTLDEIRKEVEHELLGKHPISPQYLQMQSEINARARRGGPPDQKSGSGDSVVDTIITPHKSVGILIDPNEMNLFKNKRNQKTIDQIHEEVSPEEKEKALLPQLNKQMHRSIRRGARRSRPLKQVSGSGGCWNMDDTNSPLKSVEISIDTSKMKLLKNKRNQKTIDQIHEEVSPEEKEKALLPQLNKQMHKSIRRGARRSRPLKQVSGSGGCWNMDTNSPLKSVEISIDTSKMKLLKPFQAEVTSSATALSPSSALAEPDTETPTQPLMPKEPIPEKRTVAETPAQPLVPKEPIPEKRTVAETPTQPLVPKEPIPEKRTVAETPAQPLVPKEPIPEKRTVAETPTQPLVRKEPIPEKRTVAETPAQPLVPKEPIPEKRTVAETPTQPLVRKEPIPEKRTVAETATHPLVPKEPIPEKRTDTEIQLSTAADKIVPHVEDVPAQTQELEEGEIVDDDEQAPNMGEYFRQMRKIVGREKISSRIRSFQDRMNLRTPYQAGVTTSSPPALPEEPIPEKTTDTEIQLSTAADEIIPHVEDVPAQTHELEEVEIVPHVEDVPSQTQELEEVEIVPHVEDVPSQTQELEEVEIVPQVEDVPAQTQELEEVEIVNDDEQAVSWWKIGGAAVGAGLVVYAGYCIIKKLTN